METQKDRKVQEEGAGGRCKMERKRQRRRCSQKRKCTQKRKEHCNVGEMQ